MSLPNTVVIGPGAIGGFFAACLTEAGWPVTVLARGAAAREHFAEPLTIEQDGIERHVSLAVTDDPRRSAPFDLALVCVKSMDTDDAANQLRGQLAEDGVVLSMQNGVENTDRIAAALPGATVAGVAMYVGIERESPLRIIRRSSRGPGGDARDRLVGGPPGRIGDILTAVGNASGVRVELTDDPVASLWTKLIGNVCLNTVTALGRSRVGDVFASPDAISLMLSLGREVEAVAAAAGVRLPTAAAATYVEDAGRRLPHSGGSSTLFDLEAGRPLEHDALVGAVVRIGASLDVDTPVSRTCLTILNLLDTRNRSARSPAEGAGT